MSFLHPRDPHRVPLLLRGWIENVPELREAWNDPLAEWMQDRYGLLRITPQSFLISRATSAVLLALIAGLLLKARTGAAVGKELLTLMIAVFLLCAILPQMLGVKRNTLDHQPMGRGLMTPLFALLYGSQELRERWAVIPLSGDRLARLFLLAWLLGRMRIILALLVSACVTGFLVLLLDGGWIPFFAPLAVVFVFCAHLPAASLKEFHLLQSDLRRRTPTVGEDRSFSVPYDWAKGSLRGGRGLSAGILVVSTIFCFFTYWFIHYTIHTRPIDPWFSAHACAAIALAAFALLAVLCAAAARSLPDRLRHRVAHLAAAWDHYLAYARESEEGHRA